MAMSPRPTDVMASLDCDSPLNALMPAGMRQMAPTMPQKTNAMLTAYFPALCPSEAMF